MTDETNGIEAQSPGGWKVRATGKDVVFMFIIVTGFSAGMLMLRDHENNEHRRHAEMIAAFRASVEATQELTFVISLSAEQRERLQIQMPPSLRRKLAAPPGMQ